MMDGTGEGKKFPLPHEIKLGVPITWGKGEARASVTVQRSLKAKDFKGIRANDITMDDMLKMVSRITGEPLAFIEELEADDLFKVIEVLNSFLPVGLATGESR